MIEARLQNESGRPAGSADIRFPFSIPSADPAFRLLCYIDPSGDTVFNRLQMEDFLLEWQKARTWARTPEEMEAWSGIEQLARKCREEVHLYLRFIGD